MDYEDSYINEEPKPTTMTNNSTKTEDDSQEAQLQGEILGEPLPRTTTSAINFATTPATTTTSVTSIQPTSTTQPHHSSSMMNSQTYISHIFTINHESRFIKILPRKVLFNTSQKFNTIMIHTKGSRSPTLRSCVVMRPSSRLKFASSMQAIMKNLLWKKCPRPSPYSTAPKSFLTQK